MPVGARGSETERFWAKVAKTDTCWLWTASTNGIGYGHFYLAGGKKVYAHRYSYELAGQAIPEAMHLDHLCRVRNCVNPDHLEAVTHRENCLRGFGYAAQHHRGVDCGGAACKTCARFRTRPAELSVAK